MELALGTVSSLASSVVGVSSRLLRHCHEVAVAGLCPSWAQSLMEISKRVAGQQAVTEHRAADKYRCSDELGSVID